MRIVIVSYAWDWLFQRPQQLATALARSNRVNYWASSAFWGRIGLAAVRSSGTRRARLVRQVDRNLIVAASPNWLPYRIAERFPAADCFTHRLQFDMCRIGAGDRRPDAAILASSSLLDEMVWERIPARVKVYDCFDDHVHFASAGSPAAARILRAEQCALRHAQIVFASSPKLRDRLSTRHKRVVLLPNGADAAHFARPRPVPVPPELAGIAGPILGYVGAVERWVDVDLVARVADLLPEYTVVLIGPALADVTTLQAKPNVRLLGHRPYAELAAFLHRFDVCMIPFKDNELTRSVDPVKFYEYCAAGKPTVSTPLPTMVERRDMVSIAAEAHDFAWLVRQARESDTPELHQRRIELARRNSWRARAETILREVAALEKERGVRPVDRRSRPGGCADP